MPPRKKKRLPPFDKYFHYFESVQSPESDVEFMTETFQELKGKKPTRFREDFCGTFAISCAWVKASPHNKAIGVDLDPEPIGYGRTNYLSQLNAEQKQRIEIVQDNVLHPREDDAQVVCALNFSYFIFKSREELRNYFEVVLASLVKDGIFILDCFGGSKCHEPNEEETAFTDLKFSYFWDQDSFNPITNEAQFYIHFQRKGENKRKKVFSYDWRMWSLPELQEILLEAGFGKTHVYWEGTTRKGEGNGKFKRTRVGESCESWVAYIVGEK